MEFTTNISALIRGIQDVGIGIKDSGSLPFTKEVLLEWDWDKVALTTNNLEFSVTSEVSAKVGEAGACSLHHKTLLDLLKTFDDGNIVVQLDPPTIQDSDYTLTVKAENSDSRHHGDQPQQVPQNPGGWLQ